MSATESAETSMSPEGKRSLSDVIDDIGFGLVQVKLILLAGGVYIMGGNMLFTASCLTPALAEEFNASPLARGALFSAFFLGKCLGNLSVGSLDRLVGRRLLILTMYGGCCAVSLLMPLSQYYASILLCWFALGYLLGMGTPPWNSMAGEMVPSKWRFATNSLSMVIYAISTIGTAMLVQGYDPSLKNLGEHWRKVLLFSGVPSLVLLILGCWIGIPESPYWLCSQGRLGEAREVLRNMAVENRRKDVSLEFKHVITTPESSLLSAPAKGGFRCAVPKDIRQLFSPDLCTTTLTTCFSILIINFIFNGVVYALPIILPSLELGWSPLIVIGVASAMDSLGYFLAIPASGMNRRTLVIAYLTGSAACTVMFIVGWNGMAFSHGSFNLIVMLFGIYGLRIFIAIGFVVLYTYCTEAYPTNARTAGTGFCMAAGRIGGIGCSMAFEYMHSTFQSYIPYFMLMVILCMANAGMIQLCMPEAIGMQETCKSDCDEKI